MANESFYYALSVQNSGASTPAYYSVSPTSNLTISQGGATFMPSAPSMTTVSIYPQTMQIQSPAGTMNGSVTIITDASEVAGRLIVSPPVDVATMVTLYGAGGVQLGQYIADPGTGGGTFKFPVTAAEGIPPADAPGVLKKLLGQN